MAENQLEQLSERLKSQLLLRDEAPADKLARRRTLETLLLEVQAQPVADGSGDAGAESALQQRAAPVLSHVLQCLSDPSERCRELAAQLTSAWLDRLLNRLPVCPLLVPVLRQRLAPHGQPGPAEPSEEVGSYARLLEVQYDA